MMLLAMHGLGASRDSIEKVHTNYIRRLTPAVRAEIVAISDVESVLGDDSAYRSLVRFFDAEVAEKGVEQTLKTYLPKIHSGWVRHAFHGTIRLAYGIRFNVASEISAGLAYQTCAGSDDRLAHIARHATPAQRFVWPPAIDITTSRFDSQYEEAMVADTFAIHTHVLPDNERQVAEDVLSLFNHTQNFFALHMVTGTHAMGICADAIGANVDGLMNAGLAATYLAVGAPNFSPNAQPRPLRMDFAHEVKVAFSCADQAGRLGSERYVEAYATYDQAFS